jgi:hypothetical protein
MDSCQANESHSTHVQALRFLTTKQNDWTYPSAVGCSRYTTEELAIVLVLAQHAFVAPLRQHSKMRRWLLLLNCMQPNANGLQVESSSPSMCFSAQERRAFRRLRQALDSSNARIERFMNAWHTVCDIIQHCLTFSVSLAADCSDHCAHAVRI